MVERFKIANKNVEQSKFRFNVFLNLLDAISYLLTFILMIVAYGIGVFFNIKGEITLGTVTAMAQLANKILLSLLPC
ncbi:MAG: ABC transporter transmembrane domain-containing protein [Thermoanaerobacteraceae bacterium]